MKALISIKYDISISGAAFLILTFAVVCVTLCSSNMWHLSRYARSDLVSGWVTGETRFDSWP
jgi:hypothetical protein